MAPHRTEDSLDQALAALADPARRGVIDLLRSRPRRAGDLADALVLSAPRMSQHLRVLRRCGLVEETPLEEDARVRVYRLRREPFRALRHWLDDVEGFWTAELEAFRSYVERARPSGAPPAASGAGEGRTGSAPGRGPREGRPGGSGGAKVERGQGASSRTRRLAKASSRTPRSPRR